LGSRVRTLSDIDVGSWEAVEGSEARVHVHSMLEHIISPNVDRGEFSKHTVSSTELNAASSASMRSFDAVSSVRVLGSVPFVPLAMRPEETEGVCMSSMIDST
jgi:hypothetical protein